MRILATGATGFIGSHVVELALTQGHDVVGLYRSGRREKETEVARLCSLGAHMRPADLLEPKSLRALMQDVEVVCHFAAAFRETAVDDNYFHRVNVTGTRNILHAAAAANARRFVYCGTAGIYGQRVPGTINEKSPVHVWNAYEASKFAAETEVREMASSLGLEYVILRPSAVYGPRDRRLLKMFKAAASGRFPLFGNGKGRRHMIYVTDLADAFMRACILPGVASGEFIVAGPRAVPLHDMLQMLGQVVGRKKLGPHLPLWPILVLATIVEGICKRLGITPPIYRRRVDFYRNDAAYDCAKAADLLDWKPKVDLPEGLARTYAAYQTNGLI